jgi:hypothetical protein
MIRLSKNSQFADGVSIKAASASPINTYAGVAGFFLFGIVISGIRGRKKLLMLLAGIVLSGMCIVSCGGGGGGSSSPQSSSGSTGATTQATTDVAAYTVSGLSDQTTYFWTVVAVDSMGNQVQSPVNTFTTN